MSVASLRSMPRSLNAGGWAASAFVEDGYQLGGGHRAVGVLAQLRDLRPVDIAVEPHADPAAAANVGRPEELVRRPGDELGLRASRRGAPQVRKVIVMVPGRQIGRAH